MNLETTVPSLYALEAIGALANIRKNEIMGLMLKINKTVTGPALHGAVMENFEKGGVPKFPRNSRMTLWFKKQAGQGSKPLYASGELFQKAILNPVIKATERGASLQMRSPSNRLKASAGILHDGGSFSIPKTDKMRKFFWAMHYKAESAGDNDIAETFKRMAISKSSKIHITIPPRPWTEITPVQTRLIERAAVKAFQKELIALIMRRN